jgi:hypothetical protein
MNELRKENIMKKIIRFCSETRRAVAILTDNYYTRKIAEFLDEWCENHQKLLVAVAGAAIVLSWMV